MSKWHWILRFLALVTVALVLGGFTLYGGVVLPILHDEFGVSASVAVTRRVTHALNAMCAAAVILWWLLLWREAKLGALTWRIVRVAALAATTLTAIALVLLHGVMDERLATGSMRGFYKLHRSYLLLSTLQWAANLCILATSARLWNAAASAAGESGSRDKTFRECRCTNERTMSSCRHWRNRGLRKWVEAISLQAPSPTGSRSRSRERFP